MVWRCPDGCAQAAGTHVRGVGEVAHHKEKAHLAARRSRVSKVVEATVGAVERGADIEHEVNIVRKIAQIERVWLVEVKSWERSENAES